MVLAGGIPAVFQLVGMIYLDESPRWLVARGRIVRARQVLRRIYPHASVAMIDREMTTVVIASRDSVASKVRSNIEQIRARGGPVICVGDDEESLSVSDERIVVPGLSPWLSPIANVVPLQIFAYHVALARGCDIDKPRNLAKSVTVE